MEYVGAALVSRRFFSHQAFTNRFFAFLLTRLKQGFRHPNVIENFFARIGNGNTWTGTSGVRTSNPITQFTTYTLLCDDTDVDAIEDDFTDTVNIYRVPSWLEL